MFKNASFIHSLLFETFNELKVLLLHMELLEHHYHCPWCLAPISTLCDPTEQEQFYVEDCEVCCSPIEIRFKWDDDRENLEYFEGEREDG